MQLPESILADPIRLLAGTADAVAAKTRERAAADKLIIRVVFMIWIFKVSDVPVDFYLADLKHRSDSDNPTPFLTLEKIQVWSRSRFMIVGRCQLVNGMNSYHNVSEDP